MSKTNEFKIFSPLVRKILLIMIGIWTIYLTLIGLVVGIKFDLPQYILSLHGMEALTIIILHIVQLLPFMFLFIFMIFLTLIGLFFVWRNSATSKFGRKIVLITLSVVLTFFLTIASLWCVTTYQKVTGNMCGESYSELCYESLTQNGFPLPYFFEPYANEYPILFYPFFVLDFGFYFLLFYLVLYFHSRSVYKKVHEPKLTELPKIL